MLQGKKVIIFDMDGTLIDSVGIWNQVDRLLIGDETLQEEEIQRRRDETLRKNRTNPYPYEEYCRVLKEHYHMEESVEEIIRRRYNIAQHYLKNVIDYKDNAHKFIKKLKVSGKTLVIASTTKKSNMAVYRTENENIMSKAPVDRFFDLVYTREDVTEIKPAPEVYLKVMETLGVAPEECLVFEDSLVGVEAAKAAGIETAVIYDKYSDGERTEINALADYKIKDYSEVLNLL